MFERMTHNSRVAFVLSQEEARRAGRRRISSQDLLMGLLHSEETTAPPALLGHLQDEGVEAEALLVALRDRRGTPARRQYPGHLPTDRGVRGVVEGALRAAIARGHHHIEPAHFLVALIQRQPGEARWLERRGCSEAVVDRVLSRLEDPGP
jgi:ATP-dependent Clp protease ATP-binding subunit ClpA